MLRLVERTDFRSLRDADGHWLSGMDESRVEALQFPLEQFRVDTTERAINRVKTCAAGEIFGRAALIFNDMCFTVHQRNAARTVDAGQRQRVGSRSGADEEDGHFTLEYFVETLFDTLVEFACAIGGGKTGCMQRKAFGNFRMGARPVV